MEIKIFTVPAHYGDQENEELNKFLRSHKVLEIEKEFVGGVEGYWSFCVSYISGKVITSSTEKQKPKKDFRKLLDEATFTTFEQLRKFRKQIAKDDAVAPYIVFKDVELVGIAKLPEITMEAMKKIPGVGEKKLEKYGQLIMKMYQEDEKDRKSD